jgi:hypothetical protein
MPRIPREQWHRVSDVDPVAKVGTCSIDGPGVRLTRRHVPASAPWRCVIGERRYKKWVPGTAQWPGKRPYRKFRGSSCERCGFVPVVPIQLDVNHKSGVHTDNRPENLETLCANCHRLVTFLNGHGIYGRTRRADGADLAEDPYPYRAQRRGHFRRTDRQRSPGLVRMGKEPVRSETTAER